MASDAPRCPTCHQPMEPAMTPYFYAVWLCERCEQLQPRPLEVR